MKKLNGSASHNLLKSRACEKCSQTGKRSTSFAINLYYEGNKNWNIGHSDEKGCHGCGWYDFDRWFKALNKLSISDKLIIVTSEFKMQLSWYN